MRILPLNPIAVLVLFGVASAIAADETSLRPYKHPDLAIEFTADQGWVHQPRSGDEGTHERIDPVTGIHVLMWATSSEQSAAQYLSKMSHMMDLDLDREPQPRLIDDRRSWILDAPGTIDNEKIYTLIAVIPAGRSRHHPNETNLHIVRIWCPGADRQRLAPYMEQLLDSVRITDRLVHEGQIHSLYPETTISPVDLPSPLVTADGQEFVTVRTRSRRYALTPVTVENGAPNDYGQREWDKGRQLEVDAEDFPTLAATGLHDDSELLHTATITGRSIHDINVDARPEGLSTAGFVAADEDLLSVITNDNGIVRRLGLTHPQLAGPLFKVFNLFLRDLELFRQGHAPIYNIATMLYHGLEIHLAGDAGKGWQKSIFADRVQGYWQITMSREPNFGERRYLQDRYGHLGEQQVAELIDRLFTIHTGEMVPFYIQRYGFYEGHTTYRADPVAIAALFGILDIETIDEALGGDLPDVLASHHTGIIHGE